MDYNAEYWDNMLEDRIIDLEDEVAMLKERIEQLDRRTVGFVRLGGE